MYEEVDGYYYCIECHAILENVVVQEVDEFQNEGIQYTNRKIKTKDAQKELEKTIKANEFRKTSYEEFNIILHGMVNEILEFEHVPKLKVTVLQLWIRYLKSQEIAFHDANKLNQLPKLAAHYRKS
jgi:hypothetical protein